ncbi:MAG TPA: matrixin family metalloprotease [Nocardioides sp.]|uniref:matrixin family metalloprotease n=1 Tax=Nocardioides sp. TaxID=35761 RepID=UPI002EDA12C7
MTSRLGHRSITVTAALVPVLVLGAVLTLLAPPAVAGRGAGRASSFSFLLTDAGRPAHWDACQPIPYWYNPAGAPRALGRRALRLVHTAFARTAAASGLRFVYEGRTRLVPYAGGDTTAQLPSNGIALAWSTPGRVPALAGPAIGYGGAVAVDGIYVRGAVVLDRTWRPPARGRVAAYQSLLMHEVGHAVGLAHVDDAEQIMSPHNRGRTRWGAGDRAGLTRVGAAAGCAPRS